MKKNIHFKHLDEDRKCIQLMCLGKILLKDRTTHKVLQFAKKGIQDRRKLFVSLQIRFQFIRVHITRQSQSGAGDMVDLLSFEIFVTKVSTFLKRYVPAQAELEAKITHEILHAVLCRRSEFVLIIIFWS